MGTLKKLPLTGDQYQNVDDVALGEKSYYLIDGYSDESGATVKRPGLTSFCDLGTAKPVEGLYFWIDTGWLIAVSDGNLFKINSSGTKTNLTTGGDALDAYATTGGTKRVSFASSGTYLFAANGKFVYTDTTGPTNYVNDADADAPTTATQVVYLDQYIIANNPSTGNQVFQWSDVGTPLVWTATSYASAEANPDALFAMDVGWRELFLLGTNSIETWYNDGTTPFSRLQGGTTEGGSYAPSSLLFVNGKWYFMDNQYRFVRVNGRTIEDLSAPMRKVFAGLGVANCNAYYAPVGGRELIVLSFPSNDKTYVYDINKGGLDGWSEWAYWSGSAYSRFYGQTGAWASTWASMFVGGIDGVVYKLTTASLSDNGAPIRTLRRTGHINHGTDAWKRSNFLRFRLRKSEYSATVTAPVMKVRWQDNHDGTWTSFQNISLGTSANDTEFVVKLYRNGIYRTRQYEFVQDQACGFVLVGVEENIDEFVR